MAAPTPAAAPAAAPALTADLQGLVDQGLISAEQALQMMTPEARREAEAEAAAGVAADGTPPGSPTQSPIEPEPSGPAAAPAAAPLDGPAAAAPAAAPAPAAPAPAPAAPAPAATTWACEKCTYANPGMDDTACAVCQSPRPGLVAKPTYAAPPNLKAGERIRIRSVTVAEATELQRGHGGWRDSMAPLLGTEGVVERIDSDGDVRALKCAWNPVLVQRVVVDPVAEARRRREAEAARVRSTSPLQAMRRGESDAFFRQVLANGGAQFPPGLLHQALELRSSSVLRYVRCILDYYPPGVAAATPAAGSALKHPGAMCGSTCLPLHYALHVKAAGPVVAEILRAHPAAAALGFQWRAGDARALIPGAVVSSRALGLKMGVVMLDNGRYVARCACAGTQALAAGRATLGDFSAGGRLLAAHTDVGGASAADEPARRHRVGARMRGSHAFAACGFDPVSGVAHFTPQVEKFCTWWPEGCLLREGKWHYEVRVDNLCRCPQIGFASFEILASSFENIGCGDDGHSWGVDGVRQRAWHNGDHAIAGGFQWQAGDVVGFSLDVKRVVRGGVLHPFFYSDDGRVAHADGAHGKFASGDRVRVRGPRVGGIDVAQARTMQKGHGGWADSMEAMLDKEGTIDSVDKDGDVRIFGKVWNPDLIDSLVSPEMKAALEASAAEAAAAVEAEKKAAEARGETVPLSMSALAADGFEATMLVTINGTSHGTVHSSMRSKYGFFPCITCQPNRGRYDLYFGPAAPEEEGGGGTKGAEKEEEEMMIGGSGVGGASADADADADAFAIPCPEGFLPVSATPFRDCWRRQVIESSHPYHSNEDMRMRVSCPGADLGLLVYFDARSATERKYDKLHVGASVSDAGGDGAPLWERTLTGNEQEEAWPGAPDARLSAGSRVCRAPLLAEGTDTLYFHLTSDNSKELWGFRACVVALRAHGAHPSADGPEFAFVEPQVTGAKGPSGGGQDQPNFDIANVLPMLLTEGLLSPYLDARACENLEVRGMESVLTVESEHEYKNNVDETSAVYEVPDAVLLVVVFDPRTKTERKHDWLQIQAVDTAMYAGASPGEGQEGSKAGQGAGAGAGAAAGAAAAGGARGKFASGDRVRVRGPRVGGIDVDQARKMQKGHGGWADSMEALLDKEGTIDSVDTDGDVRIFGKVWNPDLIAAVAMRATPEVRPSMELRPGMEVRFKLGDAESQRKGLFAGIPGTSLSYSEGTTHTVHQVSQDGAFFTPTSYQTLWAPTRALHGVSGASVAGSSGAADAPARTELGSDGETKWWGDKRYSGKDGWPGVGGNPPLIIPATSFRTRFVTDRSNTEWGWCMKVIPLFDKSDDFYALEKFGPALPLPVSDVDYDIRPAVLALPLHVALRHAYSPAVVAELISAYPAAVGARDVRAWLPLHHAICAFDPNLRLDNSGGEAKESGAGGTAHRGGEGKPTPALKEKGSEVLMPVALEAPQQPASAASAATAAATADGVAVPVAGSVDDLPLAAVEVRAVASSPLDVLRLLIADHPDDASASNGAGAAIEERDILMPVHWAAQRGGIDPGIFARLLSMEGGAEAALRPDKGGNLAVHCFFCTGPSENMLPQMVQNMPPSLSCICVDALRVLVQQAPAALSHRNNAGDLPLHLALRKICSGASSDSDMPEPAAAQHAEEIMSILLDSDLGKESCREKDGDGKLPLVYAYFHGAPASVLCTLVRTFPGAAAVPVLSVKHRDEDCLLLHEALRRARLETWICVESEARVAYRNSKEMSDRYEQMTVAPDERVRPVGVEGSWLRMRHTRPASRTSAAVATVDRFLPIEKDGRALFVKDDTTLGPCANTAFIEALIDACPGACAVPDSRGDLPAHTVVKEEYPAEVLQAVLAANPSAALAADTDGLPLLDLVCACSDDGEAAGLVACLVEACPEAARTNMHVGNCPLPLHFALASKMGARAIQAIAAAHPAALSLPFGWRERDAGQKEPVLEVGTVVSVSQDPTWSCSLGASGRALEHAPMLAMVVAAPAVDARKSQKSLGGGGGGGGGGGVSGGSGSEEKEGAGTWVCISENGVAFRNSASVKDRYVELRGPDLGAIVKPIRTEGNNWLVVRVQNDDKLVEKYLPKVVNGATMFTRKDAKQGSDAEDRKLFSSDPTKWTLRRCACAHSTSLQVQRGMLSSGVDTLLKKWGQTDTARKSLTPFDDNSRGSRGAVAVDGGSDGEGDSNGRSARADDRDGAVAKQDAQEEEDQEEEELAPISMEGEVTPADWKFDENDNLVRLAPTETSFSTCWPSGMLLTEGKWYFEVTIRKLGGAPQFGVSSLRHMPDGSGKGCGDDRHSWGVDGKRQKVWHDARNQTTDLPGFIWKEGDVVGFAVDIRKAGTVGAGQGESKAQTRSGVGAARRGDNDGNDNIDDIDWGSASDNGDGDDNDGFGSDDDADSDNTGGDDHVNGGFSRDVGSSGEDDGLCATLRVFVNGDDRGPLHTNMRSEHGFRPTFTCKSGAVYMINLGGGREKDRFYFTPPDG